ncbi:MAG: hypothetical protein AB7V77_00975 [Candidatus Woesearchaeota archaeon]
MKHLFIGRHASYDSEGRISAEGKKELDFLSEQIKQVLNGGSAHIVTSTAPRALDSAEVLKKNLNATVVEEPYLWSGTDAPEDSFYTDRNYDRVVDIINKHKDNADAVIVLSHLEVVDDVPRGYACRELGIYNSIGSISKGEAYYFNLEKKEVSALKRHLF